MSAVATAVVDECHAVATALANVDDGGFAIATNCPPWTMKELIVHIWQTLQLPPRFPRSSDHPKPAAEWYRRGEREADEYRAANADKARVAAEQFADGASAVAALVAAGDAMSARAASEGEQTVIRTPAIGPMTLGDYLVTRLISVAVHGLDVAISLGADPFITPAALDITAGVLQELVGANYSSLGITPMEFVLVGTGRVSVPPGTPVNIAARLPAIA